MRHQLRIFGLIAIMALPPLLLLAWPTRAAGALGDRSLQLENSAPSAAGSHMFSFRTSTSGPTTLGSVSFAYCDSPVEQDACLPGNGAEDVDVSGAGQPQNMVGVTDWSLSTSGQNSFYISHSPVVLPANTLVSFTVPAIANPSAIKQVFFVRIQTYQAANVTIPEDYGAVAAATTEAFSVEATVPPILVFCVGTTISGDCSTASGSQIDFGELTNLATQTASTQFQTGTNAPSGYVVTVHGSSMASGSHVIPTSAAPVPATAGQARFGINLRQNSQPVVGSEPAGPGIAALVPAYNQPNLYKFQPGDSLAYSPIESDFNRFTVSYVVDVAPTQPVGVYSTTLTYICTATF